MNAGSQAVWIEPISGVSFATIAVSYLDLAESDGKPTYSIFMFLFSFSNLSISSFHTAVICGCAFSCQKVKDTSSLLLLSVPVLPLSLFPEESFTLFPHAIKINMNTNKNPIFIFLLIQAHSLLNFFKFSKYILK